MQFTNTQVTKYSDDRKKFADYPPEVVNVLLFLEEYCRYSHTPRKAVEECLPPFCHRCRMITVF